MSFRSFAVLAVALIALSAGLSLARTSSSTNVFEPTARTDIDSLHAKANWSELQAAAAYDTF